jgi:hypothetical protein
MGIPYKTVEALLSEPIFSLSQGAITLVYRPEKGCFRRFSCQSGKNEVM